jgi:hypothetical protein
MAYLYRHIRLDKNEPFYIGIGAEDNYKRAYNKNKRSIFWKNISNKTQYEVEILLDNITKEEACNKEIEFIALYGRKDLGLGSLVNMTDGGEGKKGYTHTEKNKAIISFKLTGIPKPKGFGIGRKILWGDKIGKSNSKYILQYDLKNIFIQEWSSLTEACLYLNKPRAMGDLTNVCIGKQKTAYGYIWKYKQ